jgi:hypothetical protein
MTDDLSASRDRTRQLRDAVDAVDDFIEKNCRDTDEPVAVALEGITKMSSRLRMAMDGEWWTNSKTDRKLTAVRRLVESVGGKLLEVDTENSGDAVSVLKKIEKVIKPVMAPRMGVHPGRNADRGGHDLYLWHVPGEYDDNSDWRVIYTLPVPEDDFEKLVHAKHKELEDELTVAVVMLS